MTWSRYWILWVVVTLVSFLIPEIYALCTNARNTLSWQVWDLEAFKPGQGFWSWSAAHYLFAVLFFGFSSWLCMHFAFGVFR